MKQMIVFLTLLLVLLLAGCGVTPQLPTDTEPTLDAQGEGWKSVGRFVFAKQRVLSHPIDGPSIARDRNGNLSVAFTSRSSVHDSSVYVKRWNGSSWVTYGTTVDAAGKNGFRPQLRVASNNVPFVVYEERLLSARAVLVKRFVAGAWQTFASKIDDDLVSTSSDAYPSLVLKTNNLPMVAWTEFAGSTGGFNNTYVKQY
jgi:hypothetical protein